MRGITRQLLTAVLGLALSVSTAGAYYHFYHYTSRTAPFNAIPEKFDLNALPNKTVTFFVSDAAAGQLPRDQFASALNAIREAARVWSAVDSSDLRVAFGGLASLGTAQNTPGADIVFDEMDPLTLGLTSTNAAQNAPASGPGGSFVPIRRPQVRLNRNFSNWTSPSLAEAFFLTVAHEMGHALGLQHTFTASLMSTEAAGRATSLYAPLAADDIAGVSLLYPKGNLAQSTGTIAGRITFSSGQGIHLASVVAIRPAGPAVSALTDPDGRYRIDGLPPGQYLLYAHPLPPSSRAGAVPGDIVLPIGPDGIRRDDGPFDTLFYQGSQSTRDYNAAATLNVNPGNVTDNINLTLNRRTSYSIPSVTTYSFFDQTAVRPGYLNGAGTLVASGAGLTANGAPAPGLSVGFLGGAPALQGAVRTYNGTYLALDLLPGSAFFASGPRQIIFSLPTDIYVQPSGLNLVQSPPPTINSVTPALEPNGLRTLALAGSTLFPDTKFFFDGVPGALLRFDQPNRAIVAPPPGLSGVRAVITAFSADGQNSMFLQSASPASYTFDSGDGGTVTFSPNTLPAGTESAVEINGTSGGFVDGLTTVGFGSSDVQVRRIWVVSPNRILANVWVAPSAAVTPIFTSVVSGFQVSSQPFSFQLQTANSRAPVLNSQLVNTAANQTSLYPGAAVALSGSNLSNAGITIGDRVATILSVNPGQVVFIVPPGLPAGPAVLKFSNGVDTASIVVPIDSVPPNVQNVLGPGNVIIDSNRPARPGDTLNVVVTSLADGSMAPDPKRVRVYVGGVDHTPVGITPQGVTHQVQIVLSPAVGAGQVPLKVSANGRSSLPYYMAVVK